MTFEANEKTVCSKYLYDCFSEQVFAKAEKMDIGLLIETLKAINDITDDEMRKHEGIVWQSILNNIVPSKKKVRSSKHMTVLVFAIVLLLLTTIALAATLIPSLKAWLTGNENWTFQQGIGQVEPQQYNTYKFELSGITFSDTEMIVDDRSYWACIKAESPKIRVIPYSGFSDDLPKGDQQCNGEKTAYVSVKLQYGHEINDMVSYEQDEEGNVYFLCTGVLEKEHQPNEMINVSANVVIDGIETQKEMQVPVSILPTIEDRSIAEPVVAGNTGLILENLNLHRTSFRTYISYQVIQKDMPMEARLLSPLLVLTDDQGNELKSYWDYSEQVPDAIHVQVWNNKRDFLLFERILTQEDFVINADKKTTETQIQNSPSVIGEQSFIADIPISLSDMYPETNVVSSNGNEYRLRLRDYAHENDHYKQIVKENHQFGDAWEKALQAIQEQYAFDTSTLPLYLISYGYRETADCFDTPYWQFDLVNPNDMQDFYEVIIHAETLEVLYCINSKGGNG